MSNAIETGFRGRKNGYARAQVRSRAGDVLEDFGDLRKDMGRLANAATRAARIEARDAGRRIEKIGRNLRSRAGESADYVSEQVRSHPGAAIGASLGAGLLLGFLLTRR
ncbi:MAG: hypothetical protein R3C16_05260 [Hyphomonadaceae bacterium]